jgi:hypothetical protein
MTEAITEEQERVVSSARMAMVSFDAKPALFRWLGNYAPEHGIWFWQSEWHVVTREGSHWKVEIGYTNSDKPYKTLSIDGRAPAPPLLEHRPPKPEPVKPRESALHPQKVPSALEYIQHMLSYSEQDELRRMIRERQRMRRPVYRPAIWTRWDDPSEMMTAPTMYGEPIDLSDRELAAMAHAIMDRRFRSRPPPTPQPVRPPPPPTRRNQ